MSKSDREHQLEQRILELEAKVAALQKQQIFIPTGKTISMPEPLKHLFGNAEKIVHEYFEKIEIDPSQASIKINDQRYLLLRASSLSVNFLNTIQNLYADKGKENAFNIGQNFLFDIGHVIGIEDAKIFHKKMGVTDPLSKLSAGPINFAYTGWAYVNIHEDSTPSPDENFLLKYDHLHSFEADSWIQSGKTAPAPVCIMSSAYSSGWSEASFGMELTAVEISCRACGDESCTFIMAPPHKIEEYLLQYNTQNNITPKAPKHYIPTFFERKKVEESMQKAKEKAEESEKAKSIFLANISHEMRTPLNAILGYINILEQTELDHEQIEQLNIIKSSSQHLSKVISDVLDLSKIEAEQLHLNNVSCNLLELFQRSISLAKGMVAHWEKSIDLQLIIADNVPPVIFIDQVRLQQILHNILSNAVKFTTVGHVHCYIYVKDQQLYIQIEDTGIGIPSDLQEHIFDRFRQVDNSFTRKFGGAGLGLTITKKLTQLLGGKISLTSKKEQGCTFFIQIPYKVNYKPDIPTLNTKQEHQKISILFVEDNIINQKVTTHILNKAGFEVILANNGKEAIEKFQQPNKATVHLILMDIQMPVLDGLAATKAIRVHETQQNWKPIPILAYTAHATKEDRDQCLNAGCNDYITKPIAPPLLIKKIQEYIIP